MKWHCLYLAILGLIITPRASAAEPWWMQETAMKPSGELRLDDKPWWPRARALKVGEQFTVQSTLSGGGRMLVRREKRRMLPSEEMIVWIIDDDGDMSPSNPLPDKDSDCYVADYGGDGTVDQMLDYLDEDGDGDADIMEFRYFIDSRLRVGLNAVDYDDDNLMKPVIDYQRLAGDDNYFLIDTSGNSQYYHQIYNPNTRRWIPASECPFTFIDNDGDGASEVVLRFSAVPRDFDQTAEPDWANRWAIHLGPFLPMMNEMGVAAIRYSFDVDNISGQAQPHHYDMGFNLNGFVPYAFKGMERFGKLRRPPQTNLALPLDRGREVADHYPATSTGFSFREFSDGTLDLGYSELDPEYDQRWEGIFWMWRRIVMQNTGGPVQTWNVRREYSSQPADRRQIYYSPIDRRLHLKGAEEGWLRVGAIHDRAPLGEWRMYDTNGDGYFDRWEWYDVDGAEPYRVADIPAAENCDFGDDYDTMFAYYNENVIPEATRLDRLVIDKLLRLTGLNVEIPDGLRAADEPKISPGERRYLLDVTREVLYRQFRREAQRRANANMDSREFRDAPASPAERRISQDAYQVTVLLSLCDRLYGQGRFEELLPLIDQTWELALPLNPLRETEASH